MAKDPATLWYWNDWHSGTVTFTRHLKGCYMDLLHAQFNNGRLSLDAIKTVLGNDFASWGALSKKFRVDEQGLYYNERAELEQKKRAKFSESRRNNLSATPKKSHMKPHMDNENEIDIWVNGFELLKEDEKWWTEEVEWINKLDTEQLTLCLKQFWLSLQKSNFKGELKQIRAAFQKWHNSWQDNLKKEKVNAKQTPLSRVKQIIDSNEQLKKEFDEEYGSK